MAINKVVYGNDTLVDLTEDSVSANNLLEGETAHDKSGNPVTGTAKQGHTIQNSAGTDLPQENKMQFVDSHVSDDSTNGKTIVENIKEVDPADYDSTTDEGIIVTDDGNDALIGAVSDDYVEVTADGVKTYQTLLNEIFNDPKFDITKISEKSTLKIDPFVLYFGSFGYNSATFNGSAPNGNNAFVELSATIKTSNSNYNWLEVATSATTSTNKSTDQPTSGTKITLYYGNKKATVDLQTTANRCWYDANTNVKQKIDTKTTLCSNVSNETQFTLSSASQTYTVQHDAVYFIIFVSSSNTAHDAGISIGYEMAHQYFTYMYQRFNATIPLKAGTQLTFNGAVGDCVYIYYGY